MSRDAEVRRDSINALVGSLEYLVTLKPEMTLDDALPVIDVVLAEHDADRHGATRVDELLVIAKAAQANA